MRETPISPEEFAAFRADELRMVAGLLDAAGQHERAEDVRLTALWHDPPQGTA
jgi:hypothetical protein